MRSLPEGPKKTRPQHGSRARQSIVCPAACARNRLQHGWWLRFVQGCRGAPSPYWLTFKQIRDAGAHLRKGSKGVPVVFSGTAATKKDEEPAAEPSDANSSGADAYRFLRYSHVFNAAQIDGLPPRHATTPDPSLLCRPAEDILALLPIRPTILHGQGRAYFSPSRDEIGMPNFDSFDTPADYYATLFHELGHWTGHPSRLDRPRFSETKAAYAYEELIAELTSAFLCSRAGIVNLTPTGTTPEGATLLVSSAAYIASWSSALANFPFLFPKAAAAAERAAAYILGVASIAVPTLQEVAA